ncbi:hypothetical protein LUZ60_011800 [Juncus effusus]|nr:hypothetical protein LUZ60_011800 [Juncus effusus]
MCNCISVTQCIHHQAHLTPLIKKHTLIISTTNDPKSGQLSPVMNEVRSILKLALPMIMSGLLLYLRSMVSMLFLGRLGRLYLAGGSLAIGFANITGYSVLSGLAMGMEPICGQAVGAGRLNVLSLALFRTIFLLLMSCIPIGGLWVSMRHLLLVCGQDSDIASVAQAYILYSLPDLLIQSFLHPIRIYLRTQSITLPLTYAATFTLVLHFPINYLLVSILGLGMKGVAIASVLANFNLLIFLFIYIYFSGVYESTGGFSTDNASGREVLKEWKSLLNLAIPSCISVCLEWWWYEIMILLCGLLINPQSTVASMGILIQTTSLIYIFPSSLSYSVSTRVGNELGAGRPDRAHQAARVGVTIGVLLGTLAFCFALIVKDIWARAFTSEPSILHLTAIVLPILGMAELGNCPQTIACGVLRGSARPSLAANINMGAFYGVGMPISVVLAFWMGLGFRGMWLGMLAAQMACVMLMLVAMKNTDWPLQAQRAQRLTGISSSNNSKNICVVIEKDEEEGLKKLVGIDGDEETGLVVIRVETSEDMAIHDH